MPRGASRMRSDGLDPAGLANLPEWSDPGPTGNLYALSESGVPLGIPEQRRVPCVASRSRGPQHAPAARCRRSSSWSSDAPRWTATALRVLLSTSRSTGGDRRTSSTRPFSLEKGRREGLTQRELGAGMRVPLFDCSCTASGGGGAVIDVGVRGGTVEWLLAPSGLSAGELEESADERVFDRCSSTLAWPITTPTAQRCSILERRDSVALTVARCEFPVSGCQPRRCPRWD